MATSKKVKTLTEKQEKFCVEFSRTGDAGKSAAAAGYSHSSPYAASAIGCGLLTKPKIKERLQELHNKKTNAAIADAQEIKERLTAILRQETEEDVMVNEGCGDGVTKGTVRRKRAGTREALKAAELLGRMAGAFDDRVTVKNLIPVVIKDDLGDEEKDTD